MMKTSVNAWSFVKLWQLLPICENVTSCFIGDGTIVAQGAHASSNFVFLGGGGMPSHFFQGLLKNSSIYLTLSNKCTCWKPLFINETILSPKKLIYHNLRKMKDINESCNQCRIGSRFSGCHCGWCNNDHMISFLHMYFSSACISCAPQLTVSSSTCVFVTVTSCLWQLLPICHSYFLFVTVTSCLWQLLPVWCYGPLDYHAREATSTVYVKPVSVSKVSVIERLYWLC